jgi:transcriptional regulator with XRE-family HTH domain
MGRKRVAFPEGIAEEERRYAQVLRDIRDLRGETQQALGRLIGWSVSTVSRFEAAAERPDQATHRRYCALAPTEELREQAVAAYEALPAPPERHPAPVRMSPEEWHGRALDGPGLYQFFAAAYPDYSVLRLFGDEAKPLPVWAEPAPREQWADVEAPLGTLDLSQPPPDVRRWRYWERCDPRGERDFERRLEDWDRQLREIHAGKRAHLDAWNQVTYDLAAMTRDDSGRLRLDCKLGTYFHSLSTSEALDPELLEAYAAWPDSDPETVWPRLERRAWLHERVADPVADGHRRSAALGVSTLTIVRVRNRSFDGYKMFLSPRSCTVATQRRRYHVVPSGMFSRSSQASLPTSWKASSRCSPPWPASSWKSSTASRSWRPATAGWTPRPSTGGGRPACSATCWSMAVPPCSTPGWGSICWRCATRSARSW